MYAQFAAFLLGVWLTAAPGTLGYAGPAWSNDHILGPLAATAGLIAVFQETRGVRRLNLPLGVWLLAAPWVLSYPGWPETVNSMLVGVGLAALACVRGAITKRMGGGWAALWRPDPAAAGGSA
jgi:hypothetical protein